ncbi:MAG: methyltransferase domain-containing protein [Bryobacterales bacterium]|nr:methyltransferase domain-containing protein [Bryobacterales bacterium]
MRIALVSPLPPSKSGIADYSAALASALSPLCNLGLVTAQAQCARLDSNDVAVYQIGNNDAHDFVYRAAMAHPGVVVLHEANLHHLIAEITIKRGDWDGYMQAVEFDGGSKALAFAQAVRRLEVGPDYDGVPMLRRVLERTRGLIAHSEYVANICREYGFQGPVAIIPHGAWLPDTPGDQWRERLGVPAEAPLVGVFGHLKPYKRIAETLRAFRRLVKRNPFARLILVGEEHPDLPLAPLLGSLDLQGHVRHIGFAPIEDFVGYMAACDIVVNMRYPTVGESSGSMLRALGLGKPVLVSDVGSFSEFPDEVCLKVPVGGPTEEDLIYEYLHYLCEHPEEARVLGTAAREWVADTCNWNRVAELYVDFCQQVMQGEGASADRWCAIPSNEACVLEPTAEPSLDSFSGSEHDALPSETDMVGSTTDVAAANRTPIGDSETAEEPIACPEGLDESPVEPSAFVLLPEEPAGEKQESQVNESVNNDLASTPDNEGGFDSESPEQASTALPQFAGALPQLDSATAQALLAWAPNSDARGYLIQHLSRLVETLELLPDGGPAQSILEMGCYMQITPLLQERKGYGEVRGCYYGPAGHERRQTAKAPDGRTFSCLVDTFDAERDRYPYPDERFDAVVCTELFEHLGFDPIHCLAEANRILKPGGYLLLSTPNVCSARAIAAILTGYHPGFFPAFMKPGPDGDVDPRHHREYAPREIQQALADCGFTVETIRTGAYWNAPTPEHAWVEHLLDRYELDRSLRGECIFALGRKTGPAVDRYPGWLYYG